MKFHHYILALIAGLSLGVAAMFVWDAHTMGDTWLPMSTAKTGERLAYMRGRNDAAVDCLFQRLGEMGHDLRGLGESVNMARVVVTTYNAVAAQTDDTPLVTASGERSRPGTTAAVSRSLRERLDIAWGDLVLVPGHGAWIIQDLMGPGIAGDRVDLMLPLDRRHFRLEATVLIVRNADARGMAQ